MERLGPETMITNAGKDTQNNKIYKSHSIPVIYCVTNNLDVNREQKTCSYLRLVTGFSVNKRIEYRFIVGYS